MVKSGRAVLFPVYKSTFERNDGFVFPASTANAWRSRMIFWYKDLARSIDYLETRKDIDVEKIGYHGASLGAVLGVVFVALERRIQATILNKGGFSLMKLHKEIPEVDQINFAPRVKIPTLMLNGRYDFLFPFETSQIPMYRFIGTPEEHKDHKVYETGHSVPRNEGIKETLDWLDRYLGPVRRK
jgi:cephalosporin-C deacetylase-like acetyl esterase